MMTRIALDSVMPAARARDEPTGLGWALWAVASSLPWLLPTHAAPWTTFYSEVLMAAVLLPMAAWALWAARGRWRVDVLAAGFAVAAFLPGLQALGGMFSFPAEAPLVGQYLSAFALTLLVARQAEEVAPSRLVDGLFAGFAMAALLSTGIALYQWLGLDTLGVLLVPIPRGDRPVANVGQANNLSTLLVWGLVAIWWAHSRRRIGGAVATLAAAFLLMGVALTQSRTGFLAVGMLGIAALLGRRVLRTSGQAPVWFALALWFIVLVVALEPLSRMLLDEPTRSLADAAAPRQRLMILRMALDAIAQRPWLGYGWNQIVTAHVGMAAQFPMHGTVGNSHNFVLDLILWNGLPLAMLMVGGLCLWFWHALRADSTAEHVLLLLVLAVFALHAMLELPHVLAFFLLPTAVIMGTLNARRPIPTLLSLPRIAIGLVVLLHAATLLLMFDEYRRIEASAMSARMRAARIGNIAPSADPEVFVLRSLQDGLLTLRTEPRREMSAEVLKHLRRTVTRYPTPSGLFRYAQASALNGRPDDAKWALHVLCSLHSVQICQDAAQSWTQLAAAGNPEMAVVTMPMDEDGPSRP